MKNLFFATALVFLAACSRQEQQTTATTASAPATKTEPAPAPPPAPEAPQRCVPAPNRLCPVDEGAADPSFAAFRTRMLDAVKRNDEAALLALVDPHIRTSFGDAGGIDDFKGKWKTADLESILTLGGSFRGEGESRSFWAPYVYATWPESVDAFEHVAAIRADVSIRSKPEPTAGEITTIDWEILRLIFEPSHDPNAAWYHVQTKDGKEGWVQSSDVRSPVGYRAGFNRVEGEWRMTALVAGD